MSQEFDRVRNLAVDYALQEMGMNVQEVGADNRGDRIDQYSTHARSGRSLRPGVPGREWCGMFIWWVYSHAATFLDQRLPFVDTDLWSGQRLVRWTRNNQSSVLTAGDVMAGDIYVAQNFHIGMVLTASSNPTRFKSIDGNQSFGDSGRSSITQNSHVVNHCRVIVRI